jgi:hypothetical protein
MDETKARNILGDIIEKDGSLYQSYPYFLSWPLVSDDDEEVYFGANRISIDGEVPEADLEAILWWAKNKKDTVIE